jgi:hypothetical protein
MTDNKTINRISMSVHIINAIAWAGVMTTIRKELPKFTSKIASIMITGFMLEILLLIGAFGVLRTHNNK